MVLGGKSRKGRENIGECKLFSGRKLMIFGWKKGETEWFWEENQGKYWRMQTVFG